MVIHGVQAATCCRSKATATPAARAAPATLSPPLLLLRLPSAAANAFLYLRGKYALGSEVRFELGPGNGVVLVSEAAAEFTSWNGNPQGLTIVGGGGGMSLVGRLVLG